MAEGSAMAQAAADLLLLNNSLDALVRGIRNRRGHVRQLAPRRAQRAPSGPHATNEHGKPAPGAGLCNTAAGHRGPNADTGSAGMSIVLLLIPLGLVLVSAAAAALFWAADNGQFDDLDTPGRAIPEDDSLPNPNAAPKLTPLQIDEPSGS
jgi:cbb3-type cytochrome oxidase maturation protein